MTATLDNTNVSSYRRDAQTDFGSGDDCVGENVTIMRQPSARGRQREIGGKEGVVGIIYNLCL